MDPVVRLPITDMVAQRIVEYVRVHNLRPGDRLPPEKDLARDLRVSRGSVREALRSLAATGVVEMQHGLGTFVAKPSILTLLAHGLFPSYVTTARDLDDVTSARRVFEPEMTAMAAQRATSEDLAAMAAALDRMVEQASQGTLEPQPMIDFHRALLRAAGNQVLLELTLPIVRLLSELMPHILASYGTPPDHDFLQHEITIHRELYEAVKSGDPEAARAAALNHVDDAFLQARQALDHLITADTAVMPETIGQSGV